MIRQSVSASISRSRSNSISRSRSRSNSISQTPTDSISRSRSHSLVPESVASSSFYKEEINISQLEASGKNDKKFAEYFDSINITDEAKTASKEIPVISLNDDKQDDIDH